MKMSVSLVHLCLAVLLSADRIGGSAVNCSAQNYPSTPCPIPADTAVLDLSHNNIVRVRQQDFSAAKGLRKLFLQFNRISSVDPKAFQDNPALEYLDISHNLLPQIASLPFTNLPALIHLDVTNNADEVVLLGPSFGQLGHLQVLKLGNPSITNFGRASFQALGGLRLKEFHLTTGDFHEYEPESLKTLRGLQKITLELTTWENLDNLMLMLKDIVNSTDTLNILNLDLMKSEKLVPLYEVLAFSKIRAMTIFNISTTGNYCTPVMSYLLNSHLEEIRLDVLHTNGSCAPFIEPFQTFYLRKFTLKDLDNPRYIFFFPQPTLAKFLQNITDVTIINAQQHFFPCDLSDSLVNLKSLDLSKNVLREETLFPGCFKPFPVLQSLVIDYNKFQHLGFLSDATLHMKDLVNFSASYNKIHLEPHPPLTWTKSLRRLNLRDNHLSDDVWSHLPGTLKMLDLSFNDIKAVTNTAKMKNLEELYLSGNHLKSMPELSLLTSVKLLHVDRNEITAIDVGTVESSQLSELRFGHNPFYCDCEILHVSTYCQSTPASIVDWPAGFVCKAPESLSGTELRHVSFSWPTCHPGAFVCIMLICIGVTVTVAYKTVKRWKSCPYSPVAK